jgi:hypothetical protein
LIGSGISNNKIENGQLIEMTTDPFYFFEIKNNFQLFTAIAPKSLSLLVPLGMG